jgi:hypothetical protein
MESGWRSSDFREWNRHVATSLSKKSAVSMERSRIVFVGTRKIRFTEWNRIFPLFVVLQFTYDGVPFEIATSRSAVPLAKKFLNDRPELFRDAVNATM